MRGTGNKGVTIYKKMINGIGVDIVEVKKIKDAIKKWGKSFLRKVFTKREIKYCRSMRFPYIHFASRFAAKEAIAKALGTGLWRKGFKWTDIEIIKLDGGNVRVQALNNLKNKLKSEEILISMSHCQEYAVANAMIYRVKVASTATRQRLVAG